MNDSPRDTQYPDTPQSRERRSLRTRRDRYDKDHENPEPARDNFFRDLVRFSLISIALVVPIRMFVAQPFIVQGSSMDPTFESGHYLIVDQITYHFDEPDRGDVVIFHYPKDPSKFFIKRVVGLPGESVEIEEGQVTIYSSEYPDGLDLDESFVTHRSDDSLSVTLADDEYFVLGDNRTSSSDSRIWGPLGKEYIVGRAFVRLFPPQELDYLPGRHDLTPEF